MTQQLDAAAERLASVLAQENAALAALDLMRAGAMLAEKQQALAAFAAALAAGGAPSAGIARRLRGLAEENRNRVDHAITIQRRVIGIIARAIRDTAPATTHYGASGAMAAGRTGAYALSARA